MTLWTFDQSDAARMLNSESSGGPLVTGIVAAARKAGRFDVVVDGKAFATLPIEAIARLGLAVGGSICGLEERIAAEVARAGVYDRAMNMLAFRARSSSELAKSLVRKGEARENVDAVISRLQEQGLLNDTAFAESFARTKLIGAKQSRRRVQQGLARKGIAREMSALAVATVAETENVDERELMLDVARKKLRSLEKLEPLVRKRRLYAFLARRGYDSENIREAMKILRGD